MASKNCKTTVAHSVCRLCRSFTDKGYAILFASRKGHVGCLLYALDTGADVNCGPSMYAGLYAEPVSRHTPLTATLIDSKDECVNILSKAGADVNRMNLDSNTPLTIAVAKGSQKYFKIFLEAGADANIKDGNLDTALTLAIKNENFNFVKPLIEAGADVRYQGWNMLWHLAEREETTRLKTLLQVGFRVNLAEVVIKRPLFSLFSTTSVKINQDGPNVLTKYFATFGKRAKQEVAMLLHAAGETLDSSKVKVPGYLQQEPSREAIRKHLLLMSDVNLLACRGSDFRNPCSVT